MTCERWLENAKGRGWHIVFVDDAIGARRVRMWRRECEREGEPCIIVREDDWEATIEVWRQDSDGPVVWREHDVNSAPEFAADLVKRLGAWQVREAVAFEPILV